MQLAKLDPTVAMCPTDAPQRRDRRARLRLELLVVIRRAETNACSLAVLIQYRSLEVRGEPPAYPVDVALPKLVLDTGQPCTAVTHPTDQSLLGLRVGLLLGWISSQPFHRSSKLRLAHSQLNRVDARGGRDFRLAALPIRKRFPQLLIGRVGEAGRRRDDAQTRDEPDENSTSS